VSERDKIIEVCSELIAPLVRADGGDIFVVEASAESVHLHLSGTCAGCPGSAMTTETLIQPALSGIVSKGAIRVTTGWRVPDGATKI